MCKRGAVCIFVGTVTGDAWMWVVGLHERKTIQYFCNYCIALANS